MPREAIRPSAALGALLRMKRTTLGLSLGGVADRMRRRGEAIPAATMARIERGQADPGVIRLSALLRFYDVAPQVALDVVELHDIAGIEPPTGDLKTLYADGIAAWKTGDIRRGLAYLHAVQNRAIRTTEDRLLSQKARLSFSICAHSLGRIKLALQLLNELFAESVDASILFNALIHGAQLWMKVGCLELGHAFLDRAEKRLDAGNGQHVGWYGQQRARLFTLEGDIDRAREAMTSALRGFAAANDTYGALKMRLSGVTDRLYSPDPRALLLEAEDLFAEASAHGNTMVATHAKLEVGRLLLECEEHDKAENALRSCLAMGSEIRAPEFQFHSHYLLMKLYVAQGEDDRAQIELESARYFARFVEDATPEREEIESLSSVRGRHDKRALRRPRARNR